MQVQASKAKTKGFLGMDFDSANPTWGLLLSSSMTRGVSGSTC